MKLKELKEKKKDRKVKAGARNNILIIKIKKIKWKIKD